MPPCSLLIDRARFQLGCHFPAIFGSLFQSVMNPKDRRSQGAHYTREKYPEGHRAAILDELRGEFKRISEGRGGGRRKALDEFHQKLSSLRFFDPACGCGNFLIISYASYGFLRSKF